MSERSEYGPGEFCWVDLGTSNVDAAVEFYGDLIGWEQQLAGPVEETGGYRYFLYKGKQVAGIGPLPGGGHPAWVSYIRVEDAYETLAKIKEAGGSVAMGPIDLPVDAGRMAVCQDAEGAFFAVMEPKQHRGAQLVNEVGTWTWNQLGTRDLEKAKEFYGTVFGWTLDRAEGAPPDAPYFMWQVEGQRWEEGLAGAMDMTEELPAEVPPHWMVYFAIEDLDAAVAKTKAGGGQVTLPPLEIPVGRLGVIADPQGAALGLIEPDYPEAR